MGLEADDFVASSTNYSSIEVKVVDGYLDITPVTETLTVTVTGNTASMVYTGSEQSVDGYTSNAPTGVNVTLAEGSMAVAKGVDAGIYNMGLTKESFVVNSLNYSNIEVVVIDGYLEISPITDKLIVTITGNNDSRPYTGSEQSVEGFTNNAPSTVNVVLAEGSAAIAKGTSAGTYNMNLTAEDFVVNSRNYSNIEVVIVDGYLTITSVNSGGNTGGGGGGGNPGRVTPSTDGGPGAVTINPEDVPLAQLPGAPVDPTVIDDGEIPLAALPKTGQSSVKSTLTMMMSGIFLMLTAMSKKRKEEDS